MLHAAIESDSSFTAQPQTPATIGYGPAHAAGRYAHINSPDQASEIISMIRQALLQCDTGDQIVLPSF